MAGGSVQGGRWEWEPCSNSPFTGPFPEGRPPASPRGRRGGEGGEERKQEGAAPLEMSNQYLRGEGRRTSQCLSQRPPRTAVEAKQGPGGSAPPPLVPPNWTLARKRSLLPHFPPPAGRTEGPLPPTPDPIYGPAGAPSRARLQLQPPGHGSPSLPLSSPPAPTYRSAAEAAAAAARGAAGGEAAALTSALPLQRWGRPAGARAPAPWRAGQSGRSPEGRRRRQLPETDPAPKRPHRSLLSAPAPLVSRSSLAFLAGAARALTVATG